MYKLKTDYLKDAPLHRSFGQMQGPYKYVTIHDAASLAAYQAATNWSTHASKMVGDL